MTMRAAKRAAILVLLMAGALWAAPAWQVPEADLRLRVLSSLSRAHQVRVDLPESLRDEVRGVRVMLPGQREVPADLVFLGGRPVAVELAVPRLPASSSAASAGESAAPLEVYLLKAPAPAGTATALAQRAPAVMHRAVRPTQQLTTRPFTAAEAIRLLGDAPTHSARASTLRPRSRTYFYWAYDAPKLGQVPDPARTGDPGENRVGVLHWATDLRIEGTRAVAFGANQEHVAWFLYVDGKPVADWRTSQTEASGARLGAVVELAAGFHLLECVVVQQNGEPLPDVLWRDRGSKSPEPIPAELQNTVRLPNTVLVERKDGPTGGFSLKDVGQRLRARTEDQFFELQLEAVKNGDQDLPAASLLVNGAAVQDAWVRAPVVPPIRVPFGDGSLEFPARNTWLAPSSFEVDVRLTEGPAVLSADQPYPATVRLERLDELSAEVAQQLRIQWVLLDGNGATLRTGEVPCRAERVGAETTFDLPLVAGTHTAELRVTLAGLEVARRRCFRVLRPEDSLVGLQAIGRSLFLNRERAVLVCAPLAALPALPPSGRGGTPHLVILDDFWATVCGPEAMLRPEAILGQQGQFAVFRLAAERDQADGAAGELRKFDLLPPLLDQRADVTLLALGWEDLQAGASARELCRHLLFMAQAAQAHGVRPCLLALPTLPNTSPQATREAALLVKELGVRLNVPVVDAFSAERLGHFAGQPFSQYFAAAQGTVTLTTPNDIGRQRLADLVRQVLCP